MVFLIIVNIAKSDCWIALNLNHHMPFEMLSLFLAEHSDKASPKSFGTSSVPTRRTFVRFDPNSTI